MDLVDICKFIHTYISIHGYGVIINFTTYFENISDEVIEKAMNEAKYNYIKLRSGSYMVNEDSEDIKQQVIDVYTCIEENGFNEEGNL